MAKEAAMASSGPWRGTLPPAKLLCRSTGGGGYPSTNTLDRWMDGCDNQNSHFLGSYSSTLIVLPSLAPLLAPDPASKARLSGVLFPESVMSGRTGVLARVYLGRGAEVTACLSLAHFLWRSVPCSVWGGEVFYVLSVHFLLSYLRKRSVLLAGLWQPV